MFEKEQKNVYGGSSNTPPQSTTRNEIESCIDWFSCTFIGNLFNEQFCELLHLTTADFEYRKLDDKNEYDYRYTYQNLITVSTRKETEEKKAYTHIDVKGQGCRWLENNWSQGFTWQDYFIILRSVYTIHHITRLDVAIDDYTGYLNISTLHRKMREKHFRSTAGLRSWRYIESGDTQSNKMLNGQTLYVGKGDIEFRFYDKLAQLNTLLAIIPDGVIFWNRYEIQLRHDRAEVVMNMIANGYFEIGTLVKSIMSEYLCFLVPNKNDSNKSRWAVCGFWTKFLGNVTGVRLTMQPLEKSVERTKNWIEYQAAISLAVLDECFNDSGYYFKALVQEGRSRMTKQHYQMIEQFKKGIETSDVTSYNVYYVN